MDKTIDLIEFNGTDIFGDTLISIELAFSSAMAAAWLKAPAEKKSPFSLPEYLKGKQPPQNDIVIEQRLLNLD